MTQKVTLFGYRCSRCGHEWLPRKLETPKYCPNCRSVYWDSEVEINNLPSKDQEINFREKIVDRKRTDYLTHSFFAYPAKFIPQIPRYFIKEYMHNHHSLLDPFAGSGTTLVEAQLLGYQSYGIEINPLGRLLSEVKTTPLNIKHYREEQDKLLALISSKNTNPTIPDFPNLDFWFTRHAQMELGIIRTAIDSLRDSATKKFFLVCLASIIRKSSNADPRISKPVFTAEMRSKTDRTVKPIEMFKAKVSEYGARVLTMSSFLESNTVKASIIGTDARKINLPDRSVYLVLTSPPFVNAQEYFRTTKFEIYWTGLATHEKIKELETKMIGLERVNDDYTELHLLEEDGLESIDKVIKKIYDLDRQRAFIVYDYFLQMKTVFSEIMRVLDDNGYFVITIGDNVIRKVPIKTHELIIDLAQYMGFRTQKVNYDLIKVRSLSTKRNVTAGLMDKEWAMVFTK